jgi:hypothetical protein
MTGKTEMLRVLVSELSTGLIIVSEPQTHGHSTAHQQHGFLRSVGMIHALRHAGAL